MSKTVSPSHQLQRKLQKKVNYYSKKSIDAFKLIVVYPPPRLTDKGKRSLVTSFLIISQDQIIENNTKIIPNHILNHWNGNKSSAHPST